MIILKSNFNLTLSLLLGRFIVNFRSIGSLLALPKITVDRRNILQVVLRHQSNPLNSRKKRRVNEIPYGSMFLFVDGKAGFKMNKGAENDII